MRENAYLNPSASGRGLLSFLGRGAEARKATALGATVGLRPNAPELPIEGLSGGNQQKVVVARELSGAPRLVIAQQPTRGLDVRASEFVYDRLNACKRDGAGVLLISMDLDELLALSDRVLVITRGRLRGELAGVGASAEAVGALMTGSDG
jgi:ribose transport system ATP-binding protein